MNELRLFEFNERPVRVVMREGAPWWMAADVCAVLELGNPIQALTRLEDDEHTLISTEGIPGAKNPHARVVSESGLYSLVLGSRKPEAKAFKRWVVHEVLPSIRATGRYQVGFRIPKTLAEALHMAAEQAKALEEKEQELATLEPKAAFCDAVSRSTDTHTINEAAKILGLGQTRLFEWLRANGYLYRQGRDNMPYQQYVDNGTFRVVEEAYEDGAGRDRCYAKVTLTGKGLVAIQKRLMASNPSLIRPRHAGSRG